MNLTANEIQQIETDILKEVSQICENNEIDYFLAYGSLIGGIRHKGPIPWDTDADIVIPINQIDKFIKAARKSLSEKYYVDYYDINSYYPTFFPRIALKGYSSKILHLDVFKLVGLPEEERKRRKFERWSRFLAWFFEIKRMHKNYYGPFVFYKQLILTIKNILLFPIPSSIFIKQFERHCSQYSYNNSSFVMNSVPGYAEKEILPKTMYGKGSLIEYGNFRVVAPEKTEEYLKHFYGDYRQLPPESERNVKPFYEIDEIKD